jgi:hypothetical protein
MQLCSLGSFFFRTGSCSNDDVLIDLKTGRWGACIFNLSAPISDTVITVCPKMKNSTRYMKAFGANCVDTSILIPKVCSSFGGKWNNPYTDKSSCQNKASLDNSSNNTKQGCREPLPDKTYGLLYTFGYSPKPNDTCVGNEGTWAYQFNWETASWVNPIKRKLSWTAHTLEPVDETGTRLQFNAKFYKTVVDMSLGANIGSTTSSAALCDFSSTKAALETVTCDCYGGNGDCFDNNLAVPLVVGKNPYTLLILTHLGQSCGGDVTIIEGPHFFMNFTRDTFKQSICVTVTGSQVSASWYRIEDISLTSSFAEYKKPITYPAYNDKGGNVGGLLSDGVSVALSDLTATNGGYLICINMSSQYVEETDLTLYDVYDLGRTTVNLSTVEIMQLPDAYLNGTYVCGVVYPTEKEEIYFAAMRLNNPYGTIQYFDPSTIIQLYLLGGLFLLCSCYGLTILVIVTSQVIRGIQQFKLQLFVILICLFGFNTSWYLRIFLSKYI